MAAPYNVPNLTFDDAQVNDLVVDMRQRVDWGTMKITAKVEDAEYYQKSYIEATNIVSGAVHRIPKIDTFLRKVE